MRLREKLTVEEKIAIALDLIKRERTLDEIRERYRVSHTTAYKIRNRFLEGGRLALSRGERRNHDDLEARVRALEEHLAHGQMGGHGGGRERTARARVNGGSDL